MKKVLSSAFWVIFLVATLTQICTDMYTPSLPAIAHDFHVPVGASQATMSLFLLGVAITGLVYGYLSEVLGRRWTLIIGILIAIAGCMICFLAQSIGMLQVGRFVQGCGLGACSALWRSIFRDMYSNDDMARVASYLNSVFVLTVILAPFVGGYIEQYANWQTTFMVLSVWSLVVFLVVVILFKETGQHHGKHRASFSFMLKTYAELLRCRSFMVFTLCTFLTYGGLFSWITAGPVVLIKGAGISSVSFGWLSLLSGAAIGLAAMINGKLVSKVGSLKMMQIGWFMTIVAGLLTLIGYFLCGVNLYAVLIPSVILVFGASLTFANTFANAFADIGHIAGYGGGLYSGIQLAGGAVFSAILSHVSTSNQQPMAWLFIASGALAWLMYQLVVPKKMTTT